MNEITLYLTALLQELEQERNVMSVTVTESLGSAPRGAGARMLVGENGRITGTIGGGSIEYEAGQEAVRLLRSGTSIRKKYDLSEHSSEVGMVCGGSVKIAFHYIAADRRDIEELCRTALDFMRTPGTLWMVWELPDDKRSGELLGICGPDLPLSPAFPEILTECCEKGRPGIVHCGETDYYLELIAADSLVHVYGGGHVARELVPLLAKTGFACAVYDDREEFLKKEDFPEAVGTRVVSFEHLEGSLFPAAENYFVIMTRGHAFDFQAQSFAMNSPAVYIGVMGSRKKTAVLTEKLRDMGFTQEQLDQVHAPIGLPIGANTPAEIAISIAAELIRIRCMQKEGKEERI